MDIKAILREGARARRIPVLMATSDRGLVDVERFDLEPQRQILHGRGHNWPVIWFWARPSWPRPFAESDWVKICVRAGSTSTSAG